MESKFFENQQDASSVPLNFLEIPQDTAPLPSNFFDSQHDAAPLPSNFLESPQDAAPLPSNFPESPEDAAPLPSNFLLSRQDASPSPSKFLKRPQDASTSTLNFLKSPQDSSPSLGPPLYKEHPSPEPGYAVQKFDDRDDAGSVPAWKSRLNQLLPFTAVFTICTYWLYVALRVMYTIAAQRVGHTIYPVAWIFLGIEVGVACEPSHVPPVPLRGCTLMQVSIVPLLFLQVLYCFSVKTRRRPRLRLIGELVPTVDVLITCAGEELAVILDTVRAAAGVDWPQDRFRVVVLDDKASEDVQREVQLLALENSCIHYTARRKIKGVPHHFKAGNLNHGLSYVDSLGKSEYVAALDADMIVERSWLRAMLAHLLADPELALACPPQVSQPRSPYSSGVGPVRVAMLSSVCRLISSSYFTTYQRTIHLTKTWRFSSIY